MKDARNIGTPVYALGWWIKPVQFAEVGGGRTRPISSVSPHGGPSACEVLKVAFQLSRKAGLGDEPSVRLLLQRSTGSAVFEMVVRSTQDRFEADFGVPAPEEQTRDEICHALSQLLVDTTRDYASEERVESKWTVEELVAGLGQFARVDDGTDALAFRLASPNSSRTIYVYLYPDPHLIKFDLEDPDAGSEEWDDAVGRGAVGHVRGLAAIARSWLLEGGLPSSG